MKGAWPHGPAPPTCRAGRAGPRRDGPTAGLGSAGIAGTGGDRLGSARLGPGPAREGGREGRAPSERRPRAAAPRCGRRGVQVSAAPRRTGGEGGRARRGGRCWHLSPSGPGLPPTLLPTPGVWAVPTGPRVSLSGVCAPRRPPAAALPPPAPASRRARAPTGAVGTASSRSPAPPRASPLAPPGRCCPGAAPVSARSPENRAGTAGADAAGEPLPVPPPPSIPSRTPHLSLPQSAPFPLPQRSEPAKRRPPCGARPGLSLRTPRPGGGGTPPALSESQPGGSAGSAGPAGPSASPPPPAACPLPALAIFGPS